MDFGNFAVSGCTINDENVLCGEMLLSNPTQEWCDALFRRAVKLSGSHEELVSSIAKIADKNPSCLEAYQFVGEEAFKRCQYEEAERWLRDGFLHGLSIIPKSFDGAIPWKTKSNRQFLIIHYGLIVALFACSRDREALDEALRHLRWNPEDNLRVGQILGCIYEQLGDLDAARRQYSLNIGVGSPGNIYALGLLEFKQGNLVQATTALRQGIRFNYQVAGILTGKIKPGQGDDKFCYLWVPECLEFVDEFLRDLMINDWLSAEDAIGFLTWLISQPEILDRNSTIDDAGSSAMVARLP